MSKISDLRQRTAKDERLAPRNTKPNGRWVNMSQLEILACGGEIIDLAHRVRVLKDRSDDRRGGANL
ncbi:hypothetical protein CEB3_c19500 [Peptococcaceae bacterium CEB3]|nr:hypothetical protein CEB3_c19500 [Peptococcaceae bacterium CEB3]